MLIAKNLCKSINGSTLWDGLTISLGNRGRMALRGPSGSGKTLLMRTLSALDPLECGDIVYKEKPLAEWCLPEYRRHVRYLPQDASFVTGTVRDSIDLFFSFKANRSLDVDSGKLETYLSVLQLPDSFLDKTADTLSGGEKQLTALLRALLLEPTVLLLDEPTSNLDETKVSLAEELIREWHNSDSARSYIWTSHDSRQLNRMTDQTIELGT